MYCAGFYNLKNVSEKYLLQQKNNLKSGTIKIVSKIVQLEQYNRHSNFGI